LIQLEEIYVRQIDIVISKYRFNIITNHCVWNAKLKMESYISVFPYFD